MQSSWVQLTMLCMPYSFLCLLPCLMLSHFTALCTLCTLCPLWCCCVFTVSMVCLCVAQMSPLGSCVHSSVPFVKARGWKSKFQGWKPWYELKERNATNIRRGGPGINKKWLELVFGWVWTGKLNVLTCRQFGSYFPWNFWNVLCSVMFSIWATVQTLRCGWSQLGLVRPSVFWTWKGLTDATHQKMAKTRGVICRYRMHLLDLYSITLKKITRTSIKTAI